MSLDFIDWRISDKLSYGFTSGPRWNTLVTPLLNGYDRRNQVWDFPLLTFSGDYRRLAPDLQKEFIHACWVARGRLRAFRIKDWNDFEVGDGEGALAPETSTSPVQLTKTYTFGPETQVRPITLPTSWNLFGGTTPFADYTVDPLTGIATPTTTWPADLNWRGEFDCKVHFKDDYNAMSRAGPSVATAQIALEESR